MMPFFFLIVAFECFSSEVTQHQHHIDNNDPAMELINSVAGVDEEGRSRQRILAFAARRYGCLILCFSIINLAGFLNSSFLFKFNCRNFHSYLHD